MGLGGCLADDMGLGKTLQALALILDRAPAGPTLVVAPTSVCMNWVTEANRFAPTLNSIILEAAIGSRWWQIWAGWMCSWSAMASCTRKPSCWLQSSGARSSSTKPR